MKKGIILFLCLFAFLLSGCGYRQSGKMQTRRLPQVFYGTWRVTRFLDGGRYFPNDNEGELLESMFTLDGDAVSLNGETLLLAPKYEVQLHLPHSAKDQLGNRAPYEKWFASDLDYSAHIRITNLRDELSEAGKTEFAWIDSFYLKDADTLILDSVPGGSGGLNALYEAKREPAQEVLASANAPAISSLEYSCFFGTWRVAEQIGSEKESEIIGRSVLFSWDQIQIDNEIFPAPRYETLLLPPRDIVVFEQEGISSVPYIAYVTAEADGISAEDKWVTRFFVIDANTLIFDVGDREAGRLYKAVREDSATEWTVWG